MKDAFHEFVVHQKKEAVNPGQTGTKGAGHYEMQVPAGGEIVLQLRLVDDREAPLIVEAFGDAFRSVFEQRRAEADNYYANKITYPPDSEPFRVMRQAHAGLLWSKQFYCYEVHRWFERRSHSAGACAGTAAGAQ